jgi:hypothetical protein
MTNTQELESYLLRPECSGLSKTQKTQLRKFANRKALQGYPVGRRLSLAFMALDYNVDQAFINWLFYY